MLVALAILAVFAVWISLPDKAKQETVDWIGGGTSTASPSMPDVEIARRLAAAVGSPRPLDQIKNLQVELHTTFGVIAIDLLPSVAPNHAQNFVNLAEAGVYDGTRFHRVMPGFAIVGGDPNTRNDDRERWGLGGALGTLRQEFSNVPHERGIVSMARSVNINSASSQFFICLSRQPVLDGKYTVFGRVARGIEVVDRIAAGARDRKDQPHYPVSVLKTVVRQK